MASIALESLVHYRCLLDTDVSTFRTNESSTPIDLLYLSSNKICTELTGSMSDHEETCCTTRP